MTPRRRRVRRAVQLPVLAWLVVVWVALWGDLSVANVIGGAVVGVVVLVVFPLPPLEFGGRIRPWGLIVLVGRFAVDLVVASMRVAALALFSRREVHGAVIDVPLQSRSDLNLLITAELISLVPGTLLADVRHRDRTLFLHVLDVQSPADIEVARRSAHAQEWRVLRALGAADEIRAYEASGLPTRVRMDGSPR